MSAVFASLIPTFLIIATGWLCRATGFVNDQQWVGIERGTYVIFFPALIIDTLSRADLTSVPVLGVGGALVGAILGMSVLVLALRPLLESRFGIDGPSFTSVFQGSTRWNTFVGLAVAGSLFGQRGIALIAVAIAAMVPLLNLLAFYVFIRYAGQPKRSPWDILRSFVTNPFIWSCAVGLALNLLAPPLPEPLANYIEIIGRAALAAGLLIVGAGLDIRRLARPGIPHVLTCGLKLVLLPVTAVALAQYLGVRGDDIVVTIIAASVPTASAAYVLARQMGGNAALMAEILTLQTLLALVSMPLLIAVLVE
ncbi:AEC family transporter [Microvirga roseola]|uniref:AEC family transporter n=1 Tax=Microvirga roseola TaxID=2883126 RepID=UPI001E29FC4A|nr:AEC family transporter [Microvirga roseola]